MTKSQTYYVAGRTHSKISGTALALAPLRNLTSSKSAGSENSAPEACTVRKHGIAEIPSILESRVSEQRNLELKNDKKCSLRESAPYKNSLVA